MPEVLKTNSFQVPESHFVGVCPIHFHPSELPKSVEFKKVTWFFRTVPQEAPKTLTVFILD